MFKTTKNIHAKIRNLLTPSKSSEKKKPGAKNTQSPKVDSQPWLNSTPPVVSPASSSIPQRTASDSSPLERKRYQNSIDCDQNPQYSDGSSGKGSYFASTAINAPQEWYFPPWQIRNIEEMTRYFLEAVDPLYAIFKEEKYLEDLQSELKSISENGEGREITIGKIQAQEALLQRLEGTKVAAEKNAIYTLKIMGDAMTGQLVEKKLLKTDRIRVVEHDNHVWEDEHLLQDRHPEDPYWPWKVIDDE